MIVEIIVQLINYENTGIGDNIIQKSLQPPWEKDAENGSASRIKRNNPMVTEKIKNLHGILPSQQRNGIRRMKESRRMNREGSCIDNNNNNNKSDEVHDS